jgi:hypothetical protein
MLISYRESTVWLASLKKDNAHVCSLAINRAERFEVTLQFLLQQAAWLYDRQLSQVRAQMRKVGTTQSNSPSPVPSSVSGSTALGAQSAKGAPNSGKTISSRNTCTRSSRVVAPRGPSRLSSQQNDALPQRGEYSSSGYPRCLHPHILRSK